MSATRTPASRKKERPSGPTVVAASHHHFRLAQNLILVKGYGQRWVMNEGSFREHCACETPPYRLPSIHSPLLLDVIHVLCRCNCRCVILVQGGQMIENPLEEHKRLTLGTHHHGVWGDQRDL